jgi:hypothetical protein
MQFATIEQDASKVANVSVHSIVTTAGQSWPDLAQKVVELARSAARGDVLGRAAALLARSRMRITTTAKKARRKLDRDVEAHTAVIAGMNDPSGRGRDDSGSSRRRGGWHLAEAHESEKTSALMALVALPLVMAGVMMLLVRG